MTVYQTLNEGADEQPPLYTRIAPTIILPGSNEIVSSSDAQIVGQVTGDYTLGRESDSSLWEYKACSFILENKNIIRFVDMPSALVKQLVQTLAKYYRISREELILVTHEVKVEGQPFGNLSGLHSNIKLHKLLVDLFTEFAKTGFNLVPTSEPCSFFFERSFSPTCLSNDARLLQDVEIFAITLNNHNKIRLINAPQFLPRLQQIFYENNWSIASEENVFVGCYEIKLKFGSPWIPESTLQDVRAKQLLNQVFIGFRNLGFKVYGSPKVYPATKPGEREVSEQTRSYFFRKVGSSWKQD